VENKINIGVIGAGMYGRVHIDTIRQEERARVSWVCTRTEESLNQVMKEYSIEKGTSSYKELLADPEIEAVIISTPPATHAKIAVDALKAGKHILIEKPMATTRGEMTWLVKERENYPELTVLEASCRHTRLQPKFSFIKGMIEEGKIGRIYHMHHNHLLQRTFLEYNPDGRWALDGRFSGGGPLLDWGVYDLSFVMGLFEDQPLLREVNSFAVGGLRSMETGGDFTGPEQHTAAYLQFDNGLSFYYERGAGVHCEVPPETRIYGTRGGLRFSYPTWESNKIEYYSTEGDRRGKPYKKVLKVDMSKHPDNDNTVLIRHFLDCIEKKAQSVMNPELAAKYLNIIFRIYEKSRLNRHHELNNPEQ